VLVDQLTFPRGHALPARAVRYYLEVILVLHGEMFNSQGPGLRLGPMAPG
jgi:hypothetical protein